MVRVRLLVFVVGIAIATLLNCVDGRSTECGTDVNCILQASRRRFLKFWSSLEPHKQQIYREYAARVAKLGDSEQDWKELVMENSFIKNLTESNYPNHKPTQMEELIKMNNNLELEGGIMQKRADLWNKITKQLFVTLQQKKKPGVNAADDIWKTFLDTSKLYLTHSTFNYCDALNPCPLNYAQSSNCNKQISFMSSEEQKEISQNFNLQSMLTGKCRCDQEHMRETCAKLKDIKYVDHDFNKLNQLIAEDNGAKLKTDQLAH